MVDRSWWQIVHKPSKRFPNSKAADVVRLSFDTAVGRSDTVLHFQTTEQTKSALK